MKKKDMNRNLKNVLAGISMSAILVVVGVLGLNSLAIAENLFGLNQSVPNTFITITKDTVPDGEDDFLFDFFDLRVDFRNWGSEFTLDDDGVLSNPWSNTGKFDLTLDDEERRPVIIREKLTEEQKQKYDTSYVCINKTDGARYEGSGTEFILSSLEGSQHLVKGDDWDCVFTNKLKVEEKTGTLRVIKDTMPDSGEYFSFNVLDVALQKIIATFVLDDDGNSNNKISNEYTLVVPAGSTYSLAESLKTKAYKQEFECVDSNGTKVLHTNIFVNEDDFIVCTVKNIRQSEIKVTKVTQDGDTNIFDFKITPEPLSHPENKEEEFPLSNGQTKLKQLVNEAGDKKYIIQELNVNKDEYSTRYSCDFTAGINGNQKSNVSNSGTSVDVMLSPGELVHCVFYNDKLPDPQIVITKITDPALIDENFEFELSASTGGGFGYFLNPFSKPTTTPDSRTVKTGVSYTITEVLNSDQAKRFQTKYQCDGMSQPKDGVSLTVGPLKKGVVLNCTFTNTVLKYPKITITKIGTQNKDFPFTVSFSGLNKNIDLNPILKNTETVIVDPATEVLVEEFKGNQAEKDAYDTSFVCSDGQNNKGSLVRFASLQYGDEINCTFTNIQKGKITIIKDTVPNSPKIFNFDLDLNIGNQWQTISKHNLFDDGSGVGNKTNPIYVSANNGYRITETNSDGYLVEYVCVYLGSTKLPRTGKTNSVSFPVAPGEHVECTFKNCIGLCPADRKTGGDGR